MDPSKPQDQPVDPENTPTEQQIVSAAAQSAQNILETPESMAEQASAPAPFTPIVSASPLSTPEKATSPQLMSPDSAQAVSIPENPDPVQQSAPLGSPMQPSIDTVSSKPMIFGSFDDVPRTQPAIQDQSGPLAYSQLSPKKRNKWIIPIVAIATTTILLGGGLGFYFGYWTRSEVVYSRFQDKLAEVLDETANTTIATSTNYAYNFSVDTSDESSSEVAVESSGRANSGAFDSSSDITYKGNTLNVEGTFIADDEKDPYTLYLKLKGIRAFLEGIDLGQFVDTTTVDTIAKYDDRWVSIGLSDYVGGTEDQADYLTPEQSREIWKKLYPIIEDRVIGKGESGDVLSFTNPRSEKVAGLGTWAYDVEVDNTAWNNALDAMVEEVNSMSLTDNQKDAIKSLLELNKIDEPESDTSSSRYSSSYKSTQKATVWLEKNTSNIAKVSLLSESGYSGEVTSSTTTDFEISKFSVKQVEFKFTNISQYSGEESSRITADVTYDNSSQKISVDGEYVADDEKLIYKLSLAPDADATEITKPESSVDYETIINELNGN